MHSGLMSQEEARDLAEANLDNVVGDIDESALEDGWEAYAGKVRMNYSKGDIRVLLTSDRVSVFDSVVGAIPFKGQVLDEITHFHFGRTGMLVPNHVINVPSSCITVAEQCEPFLVEMVIRAYLTGSSSTSILRAYKEGRREFCGNPLPEGMRDNARLPYVMVTPSTKAAKGGHDESVPPEIAWLVMPGKWWEREEAFNHLNNQSLVLFGIGSALADRAGLILVDTKYEFGRTKDGRIVLIDEIHTPDSSRYWEKDAYQERFEQGESPKSLSKQFVRDRIEGMGYNPKEDADKKPPKLDDEGRIECAARYIDLYQRITGRRFVPDTRPVGDRVYRPLEELGVLRKG